MHLSELLREREGIPGVNHAGCVNRFCRKTPSLTVDSALHRYDNL